MSKGDETSRAWWDPFAVLGIAAAAYGVLSLLSLPGGLHPSVWEEVAVAVGLHPPTSPFPGLYRLILNALAAHLPLGTVLDALPHLGRGAIALSAAFVYLVFRDILPATLRLKAHMVRMGAEVGRLVAAFAALLFLCADPVWRAGQTFSPVSLFLLLVTFAAYLFFRFVRRGSIGALYLCSAVLGVVSAESPLGFVLAACMAVGVLIAVKWALSPEIPLVNPLVDALVREVVFKRLTYVWALAFALTLGAGGWWFMARGGMEATGLAGVPGLLFAYLNAAWLATAGAATAPGWLFFAILSLMPLIFAIKLLPRAWDDDRFLPWSVGVVYAVVAACALSQLASVSALWFWTWFDYGRTMLLVPSDTLLAFFLLFDVAAVAFALAVFGVDAVCRNYRRIAQQQYPESMLETGPAEMAASLGRARRLRKRVFWGVVVALPLLVLPGRLQKGEREMARLIAATVEETLREAEGCDALFTDGSFDALVELEAGRRGHALACLPLISPNTPRARILRQRAARDDEDRELLASDAASALRTWIAAKPDRLATCAVQIGFELWQRVKKPLPQMLGLVARPGGVDEAARARALAACATLGADAQALAKTGAPNASADLALRRKFPFVLWRLARLAQMRGRVAEEAGDRATAFREVGLSEALDADNVEVQRMRRDVNWLRSQNGGALSPREGLVIGLARADFALAGRYAAPVLAADPDDPRANFALGMMYCQDEQFARAEGHLARCLKRRPDDPAVLNNLAIVQSKLGRYDEAEQHVRRALEKYPKLLELQKTLDSILAARKAAAEKPKSLTPGEASP